MTAYDKDARDLAGVFLLRKTDLFIHIDVVLYRNYD